MAASKATLLAQATRRRQDTLRNRAADADMPSVIKPSLWERARKAYFGRELTHKQLVEHQMAVAGDE